MIKDVIDSFKENVSQKTTNPFLATIFIVWTFKNWRLLYSLWYFDKKATLNDRIAFIENYYSGDGFFYWNLIDTIIHAFGVLICTYLLLSIARFIVDIYTKILLPWISKWTDEKSIVSIEKYESLSSLCEDLEKKLEDEKAAKIKFKRELENIELKNAELLADNKQFSIREENYREAEENIKILLEQNSELLNKEKNYKTELGQLNNFEKENSDLKAKIKTLTLERENLLNSAAAYSVNGKIINPMYEDERNELVEQLERDGLNISYVEIGKKILNSEPVLKNDQFVRDLLSKELIVFKRDYIPGSSAFYEFSELGKYVFRHFSKQYNLDQRVVSI